MLQQGITHIAFEFQFSFRNLREYQLIGWIYCESSRSFLIPLFLLADNLLEFSLLRPLKSFENLNEIQKLDERVPVPCWSILKMNKILKGQLGKTNSWQQY